MRHKCLNRAISSLHLLFIPFLSVTLSKHICLAFEASRTSNPNRHRDGINKRVLSLNRKTILRISPLSSLISSLSSSSLAFGASNSNKNIYSIRLNRKLQNRMPKFVLPASLSSSPTEVAAGTETETAMGDDESVDSCLESILRFTRTNPNAVVLSLWPSAIGYDNGDEQAPKTQNQIDVSKSYLQRSGAKILYESAIDIPENVSTLLVMAMYWGEDWLRTNCWYNEQPLEDLKIPGLARPMGSWPGAKWKKELCFRQERPGTTTAVPITKRMHVLIADVGGDGNKRLWSDKYSVRAKMSRDTGHAGNSCMHLTDDQSKIVTNRSSAPFGGMGMDCNASYAFACARCLLNPEAMKFLIHCTTVLFVNDDDLQSKEFEEVFGKFCKWLGDRNVEDVVVVPLKGKDKEESGENDVTMFKKWNRPPTK